MTHLYQIIADKTREWRDAGYPSEDFPAISEILEYQAEAETQALRFLRAPQFRALETYWYLRLVEKTPHVFDLYQRYFPMARLLREALGLNAELIRNIAEDHGMPEVWRRIKEDDDFVRSFKLESLRETLTLDYPSYILALAMGAGKTMLVGAIIATEFAMAIEYPDGPFVENALVFAPGKTIIESLRELSQIPYDKILPPRMHKPFAASVKLTFTRDGDKDVPVIHGSAFNMIVTNTEKIRIQKETIRKSDLGQMVIGYANEDQAREEVANRRLRTIASLPHLAVFSDEAHHTYGQALGRELKRVRQTVDYLHYNSPNLVCVINTTGTPYFERQPLRDVVIWYGLSEGIKDNILKDVSGNIQAYNFDSSNAGSFVAEVIRDFFQEYGDVTLPDGTPAKLAMYFPQTADIAELRPVIERQLAELGLPPTIILEHHTSHEEKDEFDRFKLKASTKRLALLVDRGAEGWNVPCLFACALARTLKKSNNFVLQATTRCLRQIPGNKTKARIYLSMDNRGILDRQLQETYGETISDLEHAGQELKSQTLTLHKLNLPPLVVTRTMRTVKRIANAPNSPLSLTQPQSLADEGLTRAKFTIAERHATYGVLQQLGDTVSIETLPDTVDTYRAAVELATIYRMDLWAVRSELVRLYGADGDIPIRHLIDLSRQIEELTRHYEVTEEKVDVALALVKPEGFHKALDADGNEVYTVDITYPKDKERYLLSLAEVEDNHDFGFHYTPYNFDSNPEKSFYEQMLIHLNLHPDEVEDIYFTGAITDPGKTDFYVQYKDDSGKWRNYTPDFIIRRKDGRCLIVEIKREHDRHHQIDGENGKKTMALRKWESLNPDRLKYEMIFTPGDTIAYDDAKPARQFVDDVSPAKV